MFLCLCEGKESNVVLLYWSDTEHVPAWRHQWRHQRHTVASTGERRIDTRVKWAGSREKRFTSCTALVSPLCVYSWRTGRILMETSATCSLKSLPGVFLLSLCNLCLIMTSITWLLTCLYLILLSAISFRTAFCTSVDFRFLPLRYSGVRLTLPPLHEPQCSMGGERDLKD